MKIFTSLSLLASLSLLVASTAFAEDHGKCMSKDGKTEISTAKDKATCEKDGGVWHE